jgi:hypothetical protein
MRGNCSASLDKNRVPIRAIASGQQAVLLTIDTACHGLHGVPMDGRAAGSLVRFHMNITINSGGKSSESSARAGFHDQIAILAAAHGVIEGHRP